MMDAGSFSHLLIGLPATGKTTFLAALWYVVQEAEAKSTLVLDHVVGNTEHLNEIRNHWLKCTTVPRTHSASEKLLSMFLKERESGQPITLHVPDLAGELFQAQWRDRQWPASYERMLQESRGALLFIHPDQIQQPTRIDMVDAMAGGVDVEAQDSDDGTTEAGNVEIEWKADDAPTQVKLVELLQFIRARKTSDQPFRISVIVSAWDKVGLEQTPAEWLRHQLPLLDGVLRMRADEFPSAVFGLSAQGGEYQSESDEPLCSKAPLTRILLVGAEVSQNHDITEPVRWLMG